VVVEAGGTYPGNPQENNPHIKLAHFNQGPFYFESLKAFKNNREMATDFIHRRDALWVTPQYEWQAPYLSEWLRSESWQVTPYIWRPARLTNASSYQKKNARRVGVYETNRGVYKMSMIPIMIANQAHRQEENSIEYFETPAMKDMFTKEFKRLLSDLDIQVHAQKEMVRIPEQFEDKQIGTILSHHMLNGLNYLHMEALYLNMSLVHNSEFIKDCGYYYPRFDVKTGAEVLRRAMDTHDLNLEEYAAASAKCLWRYAPENPNNIKHYEQLLNHLI
jgi:hypothetical protein